MKRSALTKLALLSAALLLASCGPSGNIISSSSQENTISTESTIPSVEDSELESPSEEPSKEESSSKESSNEESSSSSATSSSEDPDAFKWNISLNLYGLAFQERLGDLINETRSASISYSACLYAGAKAAAYPNATSTTFIPFYHEASDANKTTQKSCNREHTWPDSRGGNNIENDPIVIRPTLKDDNSARGNNFYGLNGSNEWDPTSCGYEGARGESARVILYAVTCYHKSVGLTLSNNPSDAASANTMGTLKTLLEWNRTYAPTEFEKTVNERYYSMGHARNAFVDHPEYADYIYDSNGYRTTPYEGGGTSDSGEVVPVERTYYAKHTDLDAIDGKSFIIGSADNNGTMYASMTSTITGPDYPWYLTGITGTYENDRYYVSTTPESFLFTKQSSGKYTISTGSDYLYGYVCNKNSKDYYSIGIGEDEAEVKSSQSSATFSSISNEWEIVDQSNGSFHLKSGSVYLEYYKGSWCGYKYAPNALISLFNPTAQTEIVS